MDWLSQTTLDIEAHSVRGSRHRSTQREGLTLISKTLTYVRVRTHSGNNSSGWCSRARSLAEERATRVCSGHRDPARGAVPARRPWVTGPRAWPKGKAINHQNPKGKDGRVKMCNSCGSRAHLKADCPKKARKDARNPKELGLRRGGEEKKDCQRKEAKVGPVRDAMPRVDCWKLHVRR